MTLSDGRTVEVRAPSLLDLGEYIQFNSLQAEVRAVYAALEQINRGVIVPVPVVNMERALPLVGKVTGLSRDELIDLPFMDGINLFNEVTRLARPKARSAAEGQPQGPQVKAVAVEPAPENQTQTPSS